MRTLLVGLVALSMALAATTFAFWRDRDSERARADALQARIAALDSDAVAKTVWTPRQPMAPAPPAPETRVLQPAMDTPSAAADDDEEYMARRRQLLRDPKYYEAAHASMRSMFAERRYELIRALGISPAKADEIINYWIDIRLRDETLRSSPRTEQEQREYEELSARNKLVDEEKLRAITGDELFAKLEEHTANRPSRYKANQLRIRLAGSNDALRDDQVEPLIAVLHTEQVQFQREAQELMESLDPEAATTDAQRKAQQQMQGLLNASHRRVHNSASMILSRQQLTELDAMLRAELEYQQAQSTVHMMDSSAGDD